MSNSAKPDFGRGVAFGELPDGGLLAGSVDGKDAVLVRRGEKLYCLGAFCSHYHGPIGEGVIAGDTVRCPWHHACFSLRTGEAVRAPALDPLTCWRVERIGDSVFVREKMAAPQRQSSDAAVITLRGLPAAVVIVGAGAAGLAAAQVLRREGYSGALTMISADDAAPYDRPNLSKDYLAGNAPEEWLPLRPAQFYAQNHIELLLNSPVSSLDVRRGCVQLGDGRRIDFGALLLATGAEPVRLQIPGASAAQVLYLRSLDDSRAIVARAATATRVIVLGSSFIALEVAASLRTRGIEVHVIGRERVPMMRVLGEQVGRFIQSLHESHGVTFHLGNTITQVAAREFTLADGTRLEADFLVAGVGVRPALALAEAAGLRIDGGVVVNEYLETSTPGIFAAGDIASWPDPRSGDRLRIEHWVLAERQGQVAARNILGQAQKFDAVPFFWSQHYDIAINYVGHADTWDAIDMDGSLADHQCTVRYQRGHRTLAVATIGRDRASLQAELAMESLARPASP